MQRSFFHMITTYCASLKIVLLLFVVLDIVHLGNALKGNPGYLKLRRVRAAQLISNAVRVQNFKFTARESIFVHVHQE